MTAADLLISLERDLVEADRALKHAGDILDTPAERLGLSFSDREIARAYVAQAARAVIALQSWMEGWQRS